MILRSQAEADALAERTPGFTWPQHDHPSKRDHQRQKARKLHTVLVQAGVETVEDLDLLPDSAWALAAAVIHKDPPSELVRYMGKEEYG